MGSWRAVGAAFLVVIAAGCQVIVDLDGLDDQKCRSDEKPCPNLKLCVKKNDANTGCGATSCTPCALPHSMTTCEPTADGFKCKVVGCEPKWGRCDGQIECETDLQHDPDHCGDCMTVCQPFANAFRGCSGSCTIGGCKPGFDDCNHNPTDGCEVDLANDPAHCGRCDNPCATCQAGICVPAN